MYAFMYVDPETMPVEDHFIATKIFVDNYRNISTPGIARKHWLVFSYIRSEYYELNHNFDETELNNNQTTHPKINLIYFPKILWLLRNNGLMI